MYFRVGPPLVQEIASTSYQVSPVSRAFGSTKSRCRRPVDPAAPGPRQNLRSCLRTAQQEGQLAAEKSPADAAKHEGGKQQLVLLKNFAALHRDEAEKEEGVAYVSLSEAQQLINEVIGANQPAPPKFLGFCKNGEEELRLVNYTVNGALVGLSVFLAASQLGNPGSAADGPSAFGALKSLAQDGWQLYEYLVDAHPVLTKAFISGTVYGLGDLTAQTYEGRSWREFDAARIIRSSLCGFLAHGPLSHFFYERMDRFFIISKYFDGGDAWYAPLSKIAIDQTLFAATWNSLYYVMLGAMKLESPAVILNTVRSSWWELLKAGWRVWPIVHIITYTLIPCQDRVLWVDMVELAWVTVLSVYGQQRRERAGASACALPGVAGEGGAFTDDILRGMTVENQVVFQSADGELVVKRLDEVLVEAALLEATMANSLDKATRYTPVLVNEENRE